METVKYWSRWIAVVPAALIAAVLSAFPVHIVLYQTLTASEFVTPYPELPERVLTPLFATMAFVWVGAKVAPNYKFEAAIVLFGVCLLLWGACIALVSTGYDVGKGATLKSYGGGVAPAMALIGAFVGLFIVRHEHAKPSGF